MGPTSLDRALVASQDRAGRSLCQRPDLIARLERLEAWELAERDEPAGVSPMGSSANLKAMEQHADVERTVSGHLSDGQLVLAAEPGQQIEGKLVHLAPMDEFGDSFLAVIETGRNELRYRASRVKMISPGCATRRGARLCRSSQMSRPFGPRIRPSPQSRIGGRASTRPSIIWTRSPGTARGLVEANHPPAGGDAADESRLTNRRRRVHRRDGPPQAGANVRRAPRPARPASRRVCFPTGRWKSRSQPSDRHSSIACWRAKPPHRQARAPSPASTLRPCSSAGYSWSSKDGWEGRTEFSPRPR